MDYLNERAVQYLLRIASTSYISNKAIKFNKDFGIKECTNHASNFNFKEVFQKF